MTNILHIFKFKKSFSACFNFKKITAWMLNKSYISKVKIYINHYFFLDSCLLLVLLLSVLLFFFVIYFYLIDITYKYNKLLYLIHQKYNKLLLFWQKCIISYLIIYIYLESIISIYVFNGYCLTNLKTINIDRELKIESSLIRP